MNMTKDELIARCHLRTREVALPDIGTVEVRELTVRERGQLAEVSKANASAALAHIVALGCPIMAGDAEAVMDLPSGVVQPLADAILDLCGLKDESDPKAP